MLKKCPCMVEIVEVSYLAGDILAKIPKSQQKLSVHSFKDARVQPEELYG